MHVWVGGPLGCDCRCMSLEFAYLHVVKSLVVIPKYIIHIIYRYIILYCIYIYIQYTFELICIVYRNKIHCTALHLRDLPSYSSIYVVQLVTHPLIHCHVFRMFSLFKKDHNLVISTIFDVVSYDTVRYIYTLWNILRYNQWLHLRL